MDPAKNQLPLIRDRIVFIDTSILEKLAYGFSIGDLARLCSQDKFKVHLTSVTDGEVRRHLSAAAHDAVLAQEKFRRDSRILRNAAQPSYAELFAPIAIDDAKAKLLQAYQSFLEKVTVVDVSGISMPELLAAYFAESPPFGVPQGAESQSSKKKDRRCEFPDAISLLAMRDFARRKQSKVYVIADDNDFRYYCDLNPELVYIDKVSALIDLALNEDSQTAREISEIIAENHAALVPAISDAITSSTAFFPDLDAETDDVSGEELELEDVDLVAVEGGNVTLRAHVTGYLVVNVTYDDFSSAIYDREDDRYYFTETRDAQVRIYKDFDCIISAAVDLQSRTLVPGEIDVNDGENFVLCPDDDDYQFTG